MLAFDDVVLDLERRSAARAGRDLALTGREADLLELLLEHPRAVVTREQAIEAVWDGAAEPSVVDQYIGYLRRKLGPPPIVHTVRGVGFTLDRS
jgi:two-component system response regulator MprA